MAHAAQDAQYRLAGDPRGPGDLLDGSSGGRQGLGPYVDSRARQRAFPLQALGLCQRGGIDDGFWRQRLAQLGQFGADHSMGVCHDSNR